MKRSTLLTIFLLMLCVKLSAQTDSTATVVTDHFTCGSIVNQQTVVQPFKGGLEFIIQHRFGEISENGSDDLWGIYAASNIRMGFNYGITDKIMFGIGAEKTNKLYDFSIKYAVLLQTDKIPVAVSYYGNLSIDARKKDVFGKDYKLSNRLSCFNQLIISRKFNEKLSLQVSPSFTHFNSADSLYDHDFVGISVGGRYNFHNQMSFLFEYNQPIEIKGIQEYNSKILLNQYKPSLAFGLEIATATHSFQVFLSNSYDINYQQIYAYNNYEIGDLMPGFNITIRF